MIDVSYVRLCSRQHHHVLNYASSVHRQHHNELVNRRQFIVASMEQCIYQIQTTLLLTLHGLIEKCILNLHHVRACKPHTLCFYAWHLWNNEDSTTTSTTPWIIRHTRTNPRPSLCIVRCFLLNGMECDPFVRSHKKKLVHWHSSIITIIHGHH